jgi:hypothetical protein
LEITMARNLTPEEARDAKIAELTEQRLSAWRAKLAAGDADAMRDLQNVILDNLSVESAKAVLAHAAMGNSIHFEQLVARYMADECEAEAIAEVETLERDAQNDPENCRARSAITAAARRQLVEA